MVAPHSSSCRAILSCLRLLGINISVRLGFGIHSIFARHPTIPMVEFARFALHQGTQRPTDATETADAHTHTHRTAAFALTFRRSPATSVMHFSFNLHFVVVLVFAHTCPIHQIKYDEVSAHWECNEQFGRSPRCKKRIYSDHARRWLSAKKTN